MTKDGIHFLKEAIIEKNCPNSREKLFKITVFVFALVKKLKYTLSDWLRVFNAQHSCDFAKIEALNAAAAVVFFEELISLEHVVTKGLLVIVQHALFVQNEQTVGLHNVVPTSNDGVRLRRDLICI